MACRRFRWCGNAWRNAAPQADVMVISQTPGEALRREWAEHGIEKHVRLIAGQEMGSKTRASEIGRRRQSIRAKTS